MLRNYNKINKSIFTIWLQALQHFTNIEIWVRVIRKQGEGRYLIIHTERKDQERKINV